MRQLSKEGDKIVGKLTSKFKERSLNPNLSASESQQIALPYLEFERKNSKVDTDKEEA